MDCSQYEATLGVRGGLIMLAAVKQLVGKQRSCRRLGSCQFVKKIHLALMARFVVPAVDHAGQKRPAPARRNCIRIRHDDLCMLAMQRFNSLELILQKRANFGDVRPIGMKFRARILPKRTCPTARQLAAACQRTNCEGVLKPQRVACMPQDVIRSARRSPLEPA